MKQQNTFQRFRVPRLTARTPSDNLILNAFQHTAHSMAKAIKRVCV